LWQQRHASTSRGTSAAHFNKSWRQRRAFLKSWHQRRASTTSRGISTAHFQSRGQITSRTTTYTYSVNKNNFDRGRLHRSQLSGRDTQHRRWQYYKFRNKRGVEAASTIPRIFKSLTFKG